MTKVLPNRVGLSAASLKYFAALMMLLDHIHMLLQPFAHLYSSRPLAAVSLHLLGRMAFPIFAFFVGEGMRHSRNRRAYLIRLGIFGGITQLPFLLGLLSGSGSVIATFFLSAGISLYDKLRTKLPGWISILPLLLLAWIAHLLPTDYGWLGVLTPACVYLARSRRPQLTVLAVFMGIQYLLLSGSGFPNAVHWISAAMACLAVLLIALFYNGQRGNIGKWFFYWFYPLHLIVLGGLSMIL